MPKTKVSVTIEQSVVERVDRLSGGLSRSEIVERALKRWLNERRRLELEDEIAAYYLERGEEESVEDRKWAELGARYIEKTWK
jgi:metal-responsive CopG/Arc/MetJ family transcriptional regulator